MASTSSGDADGQAAPDPGLKYALANWLESAFGPDPGLLRLRAALRSVVSGAVTLGLLLLLLGAAGKAAIALGFMCSVLASKLVQDRTRAAQAMTLALLLAPAMAGSVIAAFLTRWPWASGAGLVAVAAAAILARGAGPRGQACGMLAFISYFIGLVTRPDVSSAPLLAAGAAAGLAAAALTRFLLIPEKPGPAIQRIVHDLDRRLWRILVAVREALRADSRSEENRAAVRAEIGRLNDTVLVAHDQLDLIARALGPDAPDLTSALLRFELAAERVARLALSRDSSRANLPVSRLDAFIERLTSPGDAPIEGAAPNGDALDEVASARRALHDQTRPAKRADAGDISSKNADDAESAAFGWDHPLVRQAVQAAVAASIAIALGGLVSERRSYWAVIAAFIVQNGVGSRGEAIIKAVQRLLGTLAGVGAGLVLATLVGGHTNIALGLVLACIFLAYYAFQQAYAVMIFAITLMLALLYGIIGQLSPQLLLLRLEETAIGAGAAVFATLFVLPTRQRDALRSSARDFVAALKEVILASAQGGGRQAERAVLAMRAKTQAMRQALAPVKRGWTFLLRDDHRQVVRSALRCDYLAREWAERGPPDEKSVRDAVAGADALLADLDGKAAATSPMDSTDENGSPEILAEEIAALRRRLREGMAAR